MLPIGRWGPNRESRSMESRMHDLTIQRTTQETLKFCTVMRRRRSARFPAVSEAVTTSS
jgi:hypothetical protein